MKKFSSVDTAALILWLLPFLYLSFVFSSFPHTVPLHYGADGEPNGYGSKNEFLLAMAFMGILSAGVYFLFKYLPAIDPKKQVQYATGLLEKIGLGIVVFVSALMVLVIFTTLHRGLNTGRLIFPAVGLLFAFLGNMMHSIKPNYFVGVRVPWTLESEENWKATTA